MKGMDCSRRKEIDNDNEGRDAHDHIQVQIFDAYKRDSHQARQAGKPRLDRNGRSGFKFDPNKDLSHEAKTKGSLPSATGLAF